MNRVQLKTVVALFCALPYISPTNGNEVHTVKVKPNDKKLVAIPVTGSYTGELHIKPVEGGKLVTSGIKIQDNMHISALWLWTPGEKNQECHKYLISNAHSGQEFVSITGIVTTAGTGGGKGKIPPFQVTVPEVDVDWVNYDDWGEENGEDTRIVYLANDVRKEFIVREPQEKYDGMLPMPDRLPDLKLTWPQGVRVYTNNVLVASPMKIKSKEWTQKGNTWPIHLFAEQDMSQSPPPSGTLAIRLERMPTLWDVNGEITYDEIKCREVRVDIALKSVDFFGTGNHTLRKQGADAWLNDKFGDDGDITINYSEWQDNNLDGIVDNADPVCYTKSSFPKMNVVLATSPNLTTSVSAKVRVKNGVTTLAIKDISLLASETEVNNLTWILALPATLQTSDYILSWSISFDGGIHYSDIGTTVTRFFIVLGMPTQVNSYGSGNKLTCKRISEVLDNSGTTANISTIASNIQRWRDFFGIDNTGTSTGSNGAKIWALLDLTEKGQCGEGSMLMEQAIRLLGIPAEYQHVLSAIALPVPVYSFASPAAAPTRVHDNTTETLYMYFINAGNFTGWNHGEGCCFVGGKLYAAWADCCFGETGGVVNGRSATSAAHHILLQLADGNPDLQRWRKANGSACDNGETVPVP